MRAEAAGARERRGSNRRQKDIDFLAKVHELVAAGDVAKLSAMAMNLARGPAWKRVVVARAIARASPPA